MSNLKDFKAGKLAVNVKTEEQARKVVGYLEKEFIDMMIPSLTYNEDKFYIFKNRSVYLSYSSDDYKIISADEFLGESMKEEKGLSATEDNVLKAEIDIEREHCKKESEIFYKEFRKLTLEEQKARLEKELEEVNRELEKPKFNEPFASYFSVFYHINYHSGEVDMSRRALCESNREYQKMLDFGNCFKTREQAEQRAKEIKVYSLLKSFSDANSDFKVDAEDFLELVFFDNKELKEEARRRYKKELEELV